MRGYRVVAATCVLLVASLVGCDKSAPGEAFNEAGTIGTWIEVADVADPGRSIREVVPTKPKKELRRLTINADKTFKLVVATPDGKADESKSIEGTWRIDGRKMLFEKKNSTLDAKFATWAPTASQGAIEVEDEKGGMLTRLRVGDEGEEWITYRQTK